MAVSIAATRTIPTLPGTRLRVRASIVRSASPSAGLTPGKNLSTPKPRKTRPRLTRRKTKLKRASASPSGAVKRRSKRDMLARSVIESERCIVGPCVPSSRRPMGQTPREPHGSGRGDGRDELSPDRLDGRDPTRRVQREIHGLDAQRAQAPDLGRQLGRPFAPFPDVERQGAGLLDRVVIATLGLAVAFEDVELVGDVRHR